MIKYLWLTVAILISIPAFAHSWHVRPSENSSGTRPGGNGAEANAWDLQTAFANKKNLIKPGDTIWVHGGSYWGYWDSVEVGKGKMLAPQLYTSLLAGSRHKPIIVKAYPGERAVVTGDSIFGEVFYNKLCPPCALAKLPRPIIAITVNGKNTWFWGLEFTSSFRLKESSFPGEGAPNIKEGTAIMVMTSDSIKLINLHVHDIPGLGIAGYTSARNTEVYGCLSYYNGFSDVPPPGDTRTGFRKNGPGIYMQNDSTAAKPSVKIIEDNIVFKNFSLGMEIYGSKNAHVNHFHIINNVVFNNGAPGNSIQRNLLLGGGMKTYSNQLIGNTFLTDDANGATNVEIGFKNGVENIDCLIKDNYILDGYLDIMNGTGLKFDDNVFMGMSGMNLQYRLCPLPPELKEPSLEFRNNTFFHPYPGGDFYHSSTICDHPFECYPGLQGFIDYKRYNVDPLLGNAGGNILTRKMLKGQEVKIRLNKYEPGMAEVLVLDWDTAKELSIPLTDRVPQGSFYQMTDAQDINAGPVVSGVNDGTAKVTLSAKVQIPIGYGDTANKHMVMPKHTREVMNIYLMKYFPYQVKLVQKKKVLEAQFYNAKGQEVRPENIFRLSWKKDGKSISENGGAKITTKGSGTYSLQVTMQNMMSGMADIKVKQ
jgi:hypothetical protein